MATMQDLDLRTHGIMVQVLQVPWMPHLDDDAGFACYQIEIEDRSSAALQPYLEAACDYVRTSLGRGNNVLVHCQQVRRIILSGVITGYSFCVPGRVAQRVHRHSVPHPRALEDLRHRL
jgi:hypothetical protein